MDDPVRVHVMAGTCELHQEEAGFWLGEALAMVVHVHERAGCAKFEDHVVVVVVFEVTLEANDIGVFERAVDIDFHAELERGEVLFDEQFWVEKS